MNNADTTELKQLHFALGAIPPIVLYLCDYCPGVGYVQMAKFLAALSHSLKTHKENDSQINATFQNLLSAVSPLEAIICQYAYTTVIRFPETTKGNLKTVTREYEIDLSEQIASERQDYITSIDESGDYCSSSLKRPSVWVVTYGQHEDQIEDGLFRALEPFKSIRAALPTGTVNDHCYQLGALLAQLFAPSDQQRKTASFRVSGVEIKAFEDARRQLIGERDFSDLYHSILESNQICWYDCQFTNVVETILNLYVWIDYRLSLENVTLTTAIASPESPLPANPTTTPNPQEKGKAVDAQDPTPVKESDATKDYIEKSAPNATKSCEVRGCTIHDVISALNIDDNTNGKSGPDYIRVNEWLHKHKTKTGRLQIKGRIATKNVIEQPARRAAKSREVRGYTISDDRLRVEDKDLPLEDQSGSTANTSGDSINEKLRVDLKEPLLTSTPTSARTTPQYEDMKTIMKKLNQWAPNPLMIILLGESGVGKTHIAKMIHEKSGRELRGGKFQPVNCEKFNANENLASSEMFGHVKGAFTGANDDRDGYIQLAENGTLFLDEIIALPRSVQRQLFSFLDTKTIQKVGGCVDIKVENVRLIIATNKNILDPGIREEYFYPDFINRLSTNYVDIPPLRYRKNEIPEIAAEFIKQLMEESPDIPDRRFLKNTFQELSENPYDWPGNIRQLKKAIETVFYDMLGRNTGADAILAAAKRLLSEQKSNRTQ